MEPIPNWMVIAFVAVYTVTLLISVHSVVVNLKNYLTSRYQATAGRVALDLTLLMMLNVAFILITVRVVMDRAGVTQ